MRAQAQGLSSAANRDGSATRGSVFGRRNAATRASSRNSDGSGAPSHSGRLTVLALAIAALALLAFTPLSQAKTVTGASGPTGTLGGQFGSGNTVARVAINNSGIGASAGTIYIADSGNNRIQRLSPGAAFERAWGWDVVQTGRPDDRGTSAFEVCTVAADCKAGLTSPTSANGGLLNSPQGVAVDQSTGDVYVTDGATRRVTEFDADGNFVRLWGWDSVLTGGTGNVSTSAFEICTVAADCQNADSGVNGGQLANNARSVELGPSGNVWVADTGNRRLQEFDSSGNFIAVYGHNVNNGGALESCVSSAAGVCRAGTQGSGLGQFGGFSPFFFDFDSAGNLYAVDNGNSRVQKFNPSLTAASEFGVGISGINSSDAMLILPDDHVLLSVRQSGESRLLELDTNGAVVDTSFTGAGIPGLSGMARNAASGLIYATTASNLAHVLEIGDGPGTPPAVDADAVTTVAASTATFSGTVDPMGNLLDSCAFQYSTDKVNWTDIAEPDCPAMAPGGGAQAISEDVTDLVPNTNYYMRLAVKRLFNGEFTHSSLKAFSTDSVPPLVFNVGATDIADTSARFVGTIDPQNSPTGYVFEYGTTPALGSSTPPVDIGAGHTPLVVSRVVGGLTPDTTYYVRLVATNAFGSTAGVQGNLHTRTDPLPLPDNRAYEQVSPTDKNFADADYVSNKGGSGLLAEDGEGARFCSVGSYGDPPGQYQPSCLHYVSKRTVAGWLTEPAMPPFCSRDLDQAAPGGNASEADAVGFDAGFDRAVIRKPESSNCALPPLDSAAPLPQKNLYRADFASESNQYQLLTPELCFNCSSFTQGGTFLAGSADFGHIVYSDSGQQTPDAPAGNFQKLFDWREGAPSTLSLVSKDTSNVPFPAKSFIASSFDRAHAVSVGGERIFFNYAGGSSTCNTSACHTYMRENAAVTYDISQSECTSSCGASAAVQFAMATPSGANVLLMSGAKLTDDDNPVTGTCNTDAGGTQGCDLYLYAHSADPAVDQNLTFVSKDNEPDDGDDADVYGVLGISDDGDTVYFVAAGQIVAGASTAPGPKIYRWQRNGGSPTVDYLATVFIYLPGDLNIGSEQTQWGGAITGQGNDNGRAYLLIGRDHRVTSDGKYLLFYTVVPLDPIADQDSDQDVYRWDEQGGWRCVSCQAPGAPSLGYTFVPYGEGAAAQRVMSDDGQRIVFTSPDPLVPADTNGEGGCPFLLSQGLQRTCQDIYEWHDGTIGLISSATANQRVTLAGISRSGRDILFQSREQLVGWDVDSNSDLYNARIGGGFPEPPVKGAPCEGDACRGGGSAAPSVPGAGSGAFRGAGNQPTPNSCGRFSKKAQRKRGVARKAARKGQAKRARALRKQARNLNRRAKRCNRRQAS